MPQTHSHPRIPKLRFPEFVWEWEEKKLWEMLEFKNWLNADKEKYWSWIKFINVLDILNNNYITYEKIVWSVEVDEKNFKNYAVKYWDVLFQRSSETREEVWTANVYLDKHNKAVFGGFVIRWRSLVEYNPVFMNKLLKTDVARDEITSRSWWSTRYNIGQDSLSVVKLFFPSLPEQQKIASFLSSVDEKIESLRTKKELLEKYKKWAMQGIFSQNIRFKDENGKDFPEWEERKLGEIGETYNWLTWKSWEDFWAWKPFVTYKQIFDNSKIDSSKFAFVSIESWEKQNKVKYWDLFFTVSSETPQEVWMSAVLLDEVEEDLYLNSFCFWFRINSFDILSPEFARLYFRYQDIRKKIIVLAQWSTRYNISKNQMMKIKIKLPNIKEQQKIADFLSEIDEKIEKLNQELESTEKWKKGLLQGMFV